MFMIFFSFESMTAHNTCRCFRTTDAKERKLQKNETQTTKKIQFHMQHASVIKVFVVYLQSQSNEKHWRLVKMKSHN